jgi:hypothetical protein
MFVVLSSIIIHGASVPLFNLSLNRAQTYAAWEAGLDRTPTFSERVSGMLFASSPSFRDKMTSRMSNHTTTCYNPEEKEGGHDGDGLSRGASNPEMRLKVAGDDGDVGDVAENRRSASPSLPVSVLEVESLDQRDFQRKIPVGAVAVEGLDVVGAGIGTDDEITAAVSSGEVPMKIPKGYAMAPADLGVTMLDVRAAAGAEAAVGGFLVAGRERLDVTEFSGSDASRETLLQDGGVNGTRMTGGQ